MYVNFQPNRFSRSVKTVHTNLFAKKYASCINLQLPIVTFKKSSTSDMHHCITYMYINFNKIGLIDQSKPSVFVNNYNIIIKCALPLVSHT